MNQFFILIAVFVFSLKQMEISKQYSGHGLQSTPNQDLSLLFFIVFYASFSFDSSLQIWAKNPNLCPWDPPWASDTDLQNFWRGGRLEFSTSHHNFVWFAALPVSGQLFGSNRHFFIENVEITFVAFPFLGKYFSFCARWPEGRLSPDVSRWFVSERASSLLAADPQPLLLIPTRSVRILRLNPFFRFHRITEQICIVVFS